MATSSYMEHIVPSDLPSASSGSWTISAGSAYLGGQYLMSGATQNDYVEWPITTAAGTWRLTLIHGQGPSYGIFTVSIDGVSIGTIDSYAAGTADDAAPQISGVAITAGNHLLRFTMATKHASASAYRGLIQHVSLLRTGE